MKTALRISIALTSLISAANAQNNLVPNPGFEQFNCQPVQYWYHQFEQCIPGWKQGAASTADIINVDASSNTNRYNVVQRPRTGSAMAHIISGESSSWVEYISATLTQPMVVGKKYYVEGWVALQHGSDKSSNGLGFYFSTGPNVADQRTYRDDSPQVHCNGFISDTGWTKISGWFTADKPYTTVTFGNFLTSSAKFQSVNGVTNKNHYSCQYYIDDLVVRGEGLLRASGDSVVTVGTKAVLHASGGKHYKWVDVRNPNVSLGTDSVLTIRVDRKTTFRVISGVEQIELTVNVRKQVITYIDELEGRKVRKGRTVTVHNDEVKIIVHDKNEVDGDSIALYYGDSLIVEHVALTKKKQTFTIKVDKNNPKQIILFAENLGSVPPNTAALTIKDGRDETDITLGSDFKFCDSVMLVYKEED